MRSAFLGGLAFAAWLCACGADLNPQPEPPGGNPVSTSGAATGSTGPSGASATSSSTATGVVTGTTATGAGGATVTGGAGGGSGSGGGGGAPGSADASVEAGPGDSSTDAKGDTRGDASAPDAEGGVAQACAFVATLDHRCGGDGDCVVGVHQTDCCGNTAAIGINRSERARFDASERTCDASYPACGCASGPTHTDSGETALDTMTIRVACVTSGPVKACRTYVTMRPPDTP